MSIKMNPQGVRRIRFAPCPEYDVECMESWLEDMARQGLILDGEFFRVYFFRQSPPVEVRYRLEAAAKSISIFDDYGGNPSPELLQISREFGWEYVTSGRDFYIFTSTDAQTREMNTDVTVHAMTLDVVRKRERSNVLALALNIFLQIVFVQKGFLSLASNMGSQVYFSMLFLLLWTAFNQLQKIKHVRELRSRLHEGETLSRKLNWQQKGKRNKLKTILYVAFVGYFFASWLWTWYLEASGAFRYNMIAYHEPLPIATLQDLSPSAEFVFDDFGVGNTITVKQDWLAPQIISFHQTGSLRKDGDIVFKGGLVVDYFYTKSPWLAKQMADELLRKARLEAKSFEELPAPVLNVDSVSAFRAIFPTIILLKGSQVVKVVLYQSMEQNQWTMQEWAEVFANSLK